MDLPLRREKHLNVFFGKEVRRCVRTEEYADGPIACQCRNVVDGQSGSGFERQILLPNMEDIPRTQPSPCMASKPAQHEGAAASKIRLRIEAPLNRKVGTNALL